MKKVLILFLTVIILAAAIGLEGLAAADGYASGETVVSSEVTSDKGAYVTNDGVLVTVHGLNDVKDMFFAKGVYTAYQAINSHKFVRVTAKKIGNNTKYSYTFPGSGEYTVCVRYNDDEKVFLHFTIEVPEPTFTLDGLKLTIGNLDGIKVIRTAMGEHKNVTAIKAAEGTRSFLAKYIPDTTAYTIEYSEAGVCTVAVCYQSGYTVIKVLELAENDTDPVEELKTLCAENSDVGDTATMNITWEDKLTEMTVYGDQRVVLEPQTSYSVTFTKVAEDKILFNSIIETEMAENDPYSAAQSIINGYWKNMLDTYRPSNEDGAVDIILFAGQSNSCGRATVDDLITENDKFITVDKSKAFTFNNNKYTTPQQIVEPIKGNGTDNKYYGFIPSFLNSYYDATGRTACACFKSVGGTMLNAFLPYTVDDEGNETDTAQKYYTEMVQYIDLAKKNLVAGGYTVGHVFLVWCQGEADSTYYGYENNYANVIEESLTETEDQKNYYKQTFLRMFNSLQEDAGVEKAFIMRIGHSDISADSIRNKHIIEAQNELCRENEDCIMVSGFFAGAKAYLQENGTVRNLMKDASHYYPEGYWRAGTEAGTNMGIYVNSAFQMKPVLLEYHTCYLKFIGYENNTVFENAVDEYLFIP